MGRFDAVEITVRGRYLDCEHGMLTDGPPRMDGKPLTEDCAVL
jgi:hypothetical protein